MLEFNKRTHKVLMYALVVLVLLQVLIESTDAATKCHQCTGINCQRMTYAATEDCADELDSCITIFQDSMVLAQGCFGQLAVELRNKCEMPSTEEADVAEITDVDETALVVNRECHKCSEDLCNNLSAEGTDCIQCDSNEDAECASDTENLQPQRCSISRAVNTYCYTKIEASRATRGCATDLVQQKECLNSSGCSLCSPSDIDGCNRDPRAATNDSGSSSGGGSGSGDSDNGASSGTGTDDSSSGGSGTGNGGSSSGGSDSGSGTGGGDSNSGSSGTGNGGSSSGGSDSGAGSGSGDGSSSGGDSGDSSSESGSGSGSDTENSGASGVSNKLFVVVILMTLPYFISFK
ncbi:uncharacterized protein [Bactrocera oleae]|uniref:uncharacterized protein n=1 Tax=Bactrocera oleae TaxID=104688 RepID=UPI00387E9E46